MVSSTTSTSSSGTLFAIGDLQGCLESLEELLTQLPQDAELLFVGDLVNRGPQSLQTLRFVKNLGSRARSILGNHDLHLLAVAAGAGEMHKKDTIADILSAPDRDELTGCATNRFSSNKETFSSLTPAFILYGIFQLLKNSLRKLTKRSLALSGSVGFKACTAIRSGHPI